MSTKALCAFVILQFSLWGCAGNQPATPPISIQVPPELPLYRHLKSELFQYRGSDGELWSFVVLQPQFGERPQHQDLVAQKEAEHRGKAASYPSPRIGKHGMQDNGVLLTFAYQTNRDGRIYSYVDFAASWPERLQVTGTVEWPNLLEPWHDSVVERLKTMKPR